MKKIKNLLALFLVFVLVFSLIGCGKKEEPVEDTGMDLSNENENDVPSNGEVEVEGNVVEDGVMAYFANMPDHIYKISETDFLDMVRAGDDIEILDIRTAEDYAKGHIKGAISVPWGTDISDNITKISQDKEVIIYCYTGQTAGQAVMTLNLAGINAKTVHLGWNMGISKVEGYEELTDTETYEFGSETYDVDTDIITALDDYYAGLADVDATEYKFYKISEDDLKAKMDAQEDIYILSVRSAEHFEEGHIEGAHNIPWGPGMEQDFSTLPTDKKIAVYCYTGQTSGQTVAGLRLLGYDAVSLNGGTGTPANAPMGWLNKGYELVQ